MTDGDATGDPSPNLIPPPVVTRSQRTGPLSGTLPVTAPPPGFPGPTGSVAGP
jgi:hypothetical protein